MSRSLAARGYLHLLWDMRTFLRLFERVERPTYPTSHFVETIGRETFDALIGAGVLAKAQPGEYKYCGDHLGRQCPWRVAEAKGDSDQTTTSETAFVRILRSLLGIEKDFDLVDPNFRGVRYVGTLVRGGREREVFLVNTFSSLEAFLELRSRSPLGSLVMFPSYWSVPPSLVERYSPAMKAELLILEDILFLDKGELRLDWGRASHRLGYVSSEDFSFCVIIDQDGQRSLSELEALRTASRSNEFDLFIDMTSALEAGRFSAGRRTLEGEFQRVALPRNHAAALIELAERRKALHPNDLGSISLSCAGRVIEKARQAVDVRLSRFNWRSIHTLRGETPESKRYLFKPPPELLFALLKPIEGRDSVYVRKEKTI